MSSNSSNGNGLVPKVALAATLIGSVIAIATAFTRLDVHAESRGHEPTVQMVQKHSVEIISHERDLKHIGDRVDELQVEQREGFEKLERLIRER